MLSKYTEEVKARVPRIDKFAGLIDEKNRNGGTIMKKTMKSLIALLLSLTLICSLALTGCGGGESASGHISAISPMNWAPTSMSKTLPAATAPSASPRPCPRPLTGT